MPIFLLNKEIIFPPVHLATREGILAAGGDLSPERLLLAYQSGIFPWYSPDEPILWWSPDPRFLVFPDKIHMNKRTLRYLKNHSFKITFDYAFESVIENCSLSRKKSSGTWITEEMKEAYLKLHLLGLAHSVEVWKEGNLIGGLYGVSIGKCFFGESMFHIEPNGSKIAFFTLVLKLKELGFLFIDSQVHTQHIENWGGETICRKEYLKILKNGISFDSIQGKWCDKKEFQ
ncbi:MAG: leucyl/phenylalanyl-tRNA--protein transferase [Spirochaetes bacterium GWB1_36_13]|nr:MAG: leucyl/phenylalanyl-tRNA--protein transferase [Spirochaetes bacterium GWB1_36_13]